ncbi:serine hydrolase domain-containing protein [Rhodosalinus halophilus]|uniref:serine hydrolase domain-containing protein n=1 Tax=Rhodosalinus halophilus TaxID=2259333 RepID=UPI001314A52D|nr:serine hydrolase domain-containing protein [Rhodosalinus halophilus]
MAQAIPARMAADGVPGVVVALLREGRPVWTRAFGLADPATGRGMTEDALFRVESISKPVTAWGVMKLAEAGRIDLDAPVTGDLAGWTPPAVTAPFTARQLLSNTAGIGLGDYAARYPPEAPRPDPAAQLAREFAVIAEPGARFSYSDTGFNLLELFVEAVTGEEFADWMAREVLRPLGMPRASYDWTGAAMPVGHDLRGHPVAAYVYPGRASGGLHATAADLARFAAAGMGAPQPVLAPESVAALHRPVARVPGLYGMAAEGYALGHFTETLSDGRTALWHGGQGYGWMSHLHMVPASGDAIVILANSQRAWPLFAVVLRAWSESLGVAPVGMARVLWAERVALGAIVALIALAAVALWRARRPVSPASRAAAGVLAAGLVAAPLWAVGQDYLFVFSILPRLSAWLGAAMLVAGLALWFDALLPRKGS